MGQFGLIAKLRSVRWLFAAGVLAAAMLRLLPLALHNGTGTIPIVAFRSGGDPDYLPGVGALSHLELHESSVADPASNYVKSYPLTGLLLHAACVRFFGDAGFVLADMLVVVLFALALRWLLVSAGSELAVAECL
ncbi:MAG: hypothetical protein JO061_20185, partial [Acidobacteriaceae bacterium]|nr:hypothetical protein [Acidobacteriaceae bacterium]